ncbi:cytidine deaminase [Dermabacteraceae bacterium TAE3-ERU27]|nr:cytidine deaminase [Dermabacteraceae bacterium TAE3-ERU27]
MSGNFPELLALARQAAAHAYAPYSGFKVGAAALTTSGRIVTGCNVENAAYGVALCAECGLVSQAVREDAGKLVAFVCVGTKAETQNAPVIMPCGRCRQLLAEHADPSLRVLGVSGEICLGELLPDSFGPANLSV